MKSAGKWNFSRFNASERTMTQRSGNYKIANSAIAFEYLALVGWLANEMIRSVISRATQ